MSAKVKNNLLNEFLQFKKSDVVLDLGCGNGKFAYWNQPRVKTMLADRRVQLNLAGFYSDFTNYQEAGFLALQFLVTNAQAASVKGAELDLVAELTQSWKTELNATYAEARFDEFIGGA